MTILQVGTSDPAGALAATQALAYGVIAIASAVLLYFLYEYGNVVLAAKTARRNLWYFAVGNGAALIFGVSGLYSLTTDAPWIAVFSEGATLFFIMFYALGFRAIYFSAPEIRPGKRTEPESDLFRRYLPLWLDYLIIGGYLAAWWGSFIFARSVTDLFVAVGWVVASGWAFVWAILLVRRHEGTSLAALARHLFPAVFAFTVAILAELVGTYLAPASNIVTGTWIVCTVLVGAFFITTATAIRQEEGEVQRLYDWTTYRRRGDEDMEEG